MLRGTLLGREIRTKTQFEAKGGDFLISRRQIIHGACGVVPSELDGAVVSNEYSTLRTKPNLRMDFLRHYSHTPYFQRTCFHSSHGVDVEKMIFKIDEWLVREIDLPPLPEQRKTAAILSSVDEVIEKTEAVIQSLQTLKKAMMQELLTRGLPGRHTRFKQTEIGEIPEEWEVRSVGEIVECCDYGLSEKMSGDASLTPILRMGNIQDGEVVLDGLKYVDDSLPLAKGLHLTQGDILFNRTNSKDLVGKVGVFVGADRPITFASYLLRMKIKPADGDGRWLGAVLSTDHNQAELRALATPGVSQANINRTKLLGFLLPKPPLDEQREIVGVLDGLGGRLKKEQATLAAARSVKSALMSVLLTGELRVTPDEEEEEDAA